MRIQFPPPRIGINRDWFGSSLWSLLWLPELFPRPLILWWLLVIRLWSVREKRPFCTYHMYVWIALQQAVQCFYVRTYHISRQMAYILSVRYEKKYFFLVVRCGRLMARWKAENQTSSMVLSKRHWSVFSWQESRSPAMSLNRGSITFLRFLR